MEVQGWVILIGVVGTLLLQIIGSLQAWQLAVLQARSVVEAKASREVLGNKVNDVKGMVDGHLHSLELKIAELKELNTQLREELAASNARDAQTANVARLDGAK